MAREGDTASTRKERKAEEAHKPTWARLWESHEILTPITASWERAQPGEPSDSPSNSLTMQAALARQPKGPICCPAVVSLEQHPSPRAMQGQQWHQLEGCRALTAPPSPQDLRQLHRFVSGISGRAVQPGADAGGQLEIRLGRRGILSPKAQIKALLCRKKRVIQSVVVPSTICPPAQPSTALEVTSQHLHIYSQIQEHLHSTRSSLKPFLIVLEPLQNRTQAAGEVLEHPPRTAESPSLRGLCSVQLSLTLCEHTRLLVTTAVPLEGFFEQSSELSLQRQQPASAQCSSNKHRRGTRCPVSPPGRVFFSSQSLQRERRVPRNKNIFSLEGRGSNEQPQFMCKPGNGRVRRCGVSQDPCLASQVVFIPLFRDELAGTDTQLSSPALPAPSPTCSSQHRARLPLGAWIQPTALLPSPEVARISPACL